MIKANDFIDFTFQEFGSIEYERNRHVWDGNRSETFTARVVDRGSIIHSGLNFYRQAPNMTRSQYDAIESIDLSGLYFHAGPIIDQTLDEDYDGFCLHSSSECRYGRTKFSTCIDMHAVDNHRNLVDIEPNKPPEWVKRRRDNLARLSKRK